LGHQKSREFEKIRIRNKIFLRGGGETLNRK